MEKNKEKLLDSITKNFLTAKNARESINDDVGISIEDTWDDEYLIYKGGGLQWSTNLAYRSKKNRKIRPNSEDNFVFNILNTQMANITSNIPDISITGIEEDDKEIAEKLTYSSKHNDIKNRFNEKFKKFVYDFCTTGPTIAQIIWDSEWIGGEGPRRWIGDVRIDRIDKREMYFDPAIIDLEENLQDCGFIIRRLRKKVSYIKNRWSHFKDKISEVLNEDEMINEGNDPQLTYLYQYWYRGFPYFVNNEESSSFINKESDYFKKINNKDKSSGNIKGVHVAYSIDGLLLEHRSYEYDDGLYPFVFMTKYFDEKCQWGWGEIRNIKIPQIMHNKADEIDIDSMAKEGLGGAYYNKGAVNPTQLNSIVKNSGKGGEWFEVDNVQLIKDRTGPKVPASIPNYKDSKERIINSIQPATTIQQGISPGANVPYATIQELGNRTDVRIKQVSDKFEDFIKRINEFRINRFIQFYNDDRHYMIKGSDKKMKTGTLNSSEIKKSWEREIEEDGNIFTMTEEFIPEFDISVTVMSEKPTDRNYYTSLATQLFNWQILGPEDLLTTLENGKLPSIEEILKHFYARQQFQGILAEIQNMPPEAQEMLQKAIQNLLESTMAQLQQQNQI